tara:strand:- start:7831 stop:8481 length:651 start_codon:yes stop_codon:yes gene_type:complete
MNYQELVAAIETYTENTFTETELGTFAQQAEQRIYNTVQLANLRKNVIGHFTSGNKYLSTPADFLSVYEITVVDSDGNYIALLNKDVNFIREVYPAPSSTGVPKYYAIFGPVTNLDTELSLIVGPMPDSSYAVELHYYYYPESIVTAGNTWLGDNFDSALLYGSLVEAYTFMKGEMDLMGIYDGKYKEALALLKNFGDGKQRGDAYRDGQVKNKVM